MITFNCKLFSVSCSSCLSANEAEARISSSDYGGGILPWPQISRVGVATLDQAGDGNLWAIATLNQLPPHMRRQTTLV